MRIKLERSFCDAHGLCVLQAPDVFQFDDADELVVVQEFPPEDLRDQIRAAVHGCPKQALSFEG